jgi:hypothetical protein
MYHDFCKKNQENVMIGFIVLKALIQNQENVMKNYLYLLPKWILKIKIKIET